MNDELTDRILYHLNQELRLYGFGGEYRKVAKTCQMMYMNGAIVDKYYYICHALDLSIANCQYMFDISE